MAWTATSIPVCVGSSPEQGARLALRLADGETSLQDRLQGVYSQNLARDIGDFVLLRADGLWAYQLAVVVDDAEQGVSDVVRGADLLVSTPRQIAVQQALGVPTPLIAICRCWSMPPGKNCQADAGAGDFRRRRRRGTATGAEPPGPYAAAGLRQPGRVVGMGARQLVAGRVPAGPITIDA